MTKAHGYWLASVSRGTLVAGVVAALLLTDFLCGHLGGASFPATTTVRVSIPYERRTFKVVNDFVVVWQARWSDRSRDQVELFNGSGQRLLLLNPLKAVQDAREMSIWDVAVGATGLVAVAAVFADEEGRHSASLLLYSGTGGLIRAYSLDPDRMIRRLAVDEEENVWALGENSGDEDPAVVPMVFKYDRDGKLVGRYVPRLELPPVVTGDPGPGPGPDAMGLTKDGVWFWLPERRVLVTFHRDGTHVEILRLGSPTWTTPEGTSSSEAEVIFGKPCLLSTGRFIVRVSFRTATSVQSGIYTWENTKGVWKVLSSSETTLPKGNIVGTDGDRVVFGIARGDQPEIEFESIDLPL